MSLEGYLRLAERRAGLLVAALALVALVSLTLARRLELHADLAELLPRGHPAVTALRQLARHQRLGGSLIVLVESPDRQSNLRFLEALRPRLERLRPDLFAEIEWGPDAALRPWIERWRWLYADRTSLERAEDLLDRAFLRLQPLALELEDEDPRAELRRLQAQALDAAPAPPRSPYFEKALPGRHRVGILLWRGADGLASASDRRALGAVRAAVAETGPARFHPALQIGLTGHIAQALEDQDSIRGELALATVTCTALILLVIALYFRRVGLVAVVGAPALLGLFVALALASFTLPALNLNTAFLLSIILGNGINSPIVLLSRFGEERLRGAELAPALRIAVRASLRGTLGAMGAASIAYGSLLATDFRGFSQFGWLGGTGMLLTWIFTFLLVPPLVHLGERLRPGLLSPRANRFRRPFAALGEGAARRPAAFLWATVGLGVLCLLPLVRLAADPLEWNLRKLRPDRTSARLLWQKAEELGINNPDTGYVGSHGALLVDRPEEAEPVAEALRARDRALGDPVFRRVRTLGSLLPRDQTAKLALLARIRAKIDRRLPGLTDRERKEALAWRPPDDLRPLGPEDLPEVVRRAFTERDGQVGRLVLMSVDPATYSDWNGHDLLRLARHLRVEALGRSFVAASPATVFAGIIETLVRDGPRVAAIALAGVTLLVLLVLGPARALPALATQALGLIWLGGLLGLVGMKINFFNFVGIPITLGVGADYAANLAARAAAEPGRPLGELLGGTGSAVALCSATTIIGYSSLLLASDPALRSFGIVADLGEVCCLAAALFFLPGWLGKRRR